MSFRNTMLVMSLVVSVGLALSAPVMGEEYYHFTYAYGPWDAAEGRIDPDEQPDDPYFQYVEKTVGAAPLTVSWEWEGAKGYIQGLRLYLASGELPEAMRTFNLELTTELLENDMLLPLDDLVKAYPDLFAAISESEWNIARSQAPDGKIYYLPHISYPPTIRSGFIREDWLERVGMDVPTTKDELIEVYKAFRDQDANGNGDPNDEIPVSGREGLRWCDDLFIIHGVKMWEGHPKLAWDAEQQRMISHQVSDEMKAAVEFIRYLVEENLMDPVMPIQKRQDWVAKINANRVGHYFHLIREMGNYSAFMEEYPDAAWTYLPMVSVPGVPPQKHLWPTAEFMRPALVITKAAKDPARIMEWFHWGTATMDGLLYGELGIPGQDWNDAGETIEILNHVSSGYRYNPPGRLLYSSDVLGLTQLGDTKVDLMEKALAVGVEGFDDSGIPLSVYEGYEDYMPDRAVLFREYASKIILGQLSMEAWDDYIEAWYARGGEEVLQRATDWYKSVNNID